MEEIYRTRRDRLRKAALELFPGKGSQRLLAEHLGREPNYISRMLSSPEKKGHKRIGEELAREFESQLRKPAYWLDGWDNQGKEISGTESVLDEVATDSVDIRYYPEVAASAGHGCLPISEATVLMMKVARAVLQRRGVAPGDAALLQADGDSMRGTVNHGDLMLLNLADNKPRDGRVYVVSVGEDVLVKRVQRVPNGIKLIADNPAYDSIAIMDEDQGTDVTVVGRVVIAWQSHDLLD